MIKTDKIVTTVTLVAIAAVLVVGLVKIYQAVNEAPSKSTDIALPKVDQATLNSARARSDAGHFETDQEVSNTRANPFEHYGGYVAPAAPTPSTDSTTATTSPTTTSANTTTTTTTTPTTTTSSTATTGSTTSSTSPATESDGGKQLPTLPTDLKKAGF